MIRRTLRIQLQQVIKTQKTIIIYGPRQVGKTTLLQQLAQQFGQDARYIDCDFLSNRSILDIRSPQDLRNLCEGKKYILIDEAQRIANIWLILKIIHDSEYDVQVIATGSSSFSLSQHIHEPMTGRAYQMKMFPLSYEELKTHYDTLWIHDHLDELLIYGSYPALINDSIIDKKNKLDMISGNYLYKDILAMDNIKKSDKLEKLLQLIALQIGNQVSYHELWQKLWMSSITIEKYIRLLEESFIILRLPSFHRNLRNELTKSQKIFFRDLGVRNSLLQDFRPLALRQDVWALWENFIIMERIKYNYATNKRVKSYFRRNHQQQEIDLIEECDGILQAFEIKYSANKSGSLSSEFAKSYGVNTITTINTKNYWWYLS